MARKLCIVFFLSGASALIFEMVWFQLAGLTFGASVRASAIVLGSFMGGLALGNGLCALRGQRIRSPLRLYAGLELAIAVPGLVLVLAFPLLTNVLGRALRPLLEHPLLLDVARGAFAILLLLIPATAMGATLPVLVRALSREEENFGRVLGMLYGWNTLGAVAGVLVAELWAVPWLGLRGAGALAAVLNLSAAALALWAARGRRRGGAAFPQPTPSRLRITGRGGRLLGVAFLVGFAMLGLEVLWFRFIVLFYNGHSRNFAVMLAAVLLGISLGGLIAARWCRRDTDAHRHLAPLLALNGILVVVLYGSLIHLLRFLQPRVDYDWQVVIVSVFLIIPVAMGSGIAFTFLGRALRETVASETTTAGLLTLLNTSGAMVGSLVAGFALLPRLGLERSFFAMAAVYALTALWIPRRGGAILRQRWAPVAMLALALLLFPFGRMEGSYLRWTSDGFEGERLVAVREGLTETAQYLRRELLGRPYYHRLVTNNYTMADTTALSKRYTKLFAYMPLAVHPRLQRALLICFGCGSTAKALTDTRSYERIDVVDLSRDIVEMSEVVYPDPKENPIHDPRVEVYIEDGRFFLQTREDRYDLITGEPPPPAARGVVNLYTQEFFELIRARLRVGGIATYWLPAHLLIESEAKSILHGFCNVFDNCSLWLGAGTNYMMVGINEAGEGAAWPGQPIDVEAFSRPWKDPVIGDDLRALGIDSPERLASLFVMDGERLREWIGDTPPLVDDFPRRVSHRTQARRVAERGYMRRVTEADSWESFRSSETMRGIWPDSLHAGSGAHFARRQIVNDLTWGRPLPVDFLLRSVLDPLLRNYVLRACASDDDAQRILGDVLDGALADDDPGGEVLRHLAAGAAQRGEYAVAERFLERAVATVGGVGQQRLATYRMAFMTFEGRMDKAHEIGRAYIEAGESDRPRRAEAMESYWETLLRVADQLEKASGLAGL